MLQNRTRQGKCQAGSPSLRTIGIVGLSEPRHGQKLVENVGTVSATRALQELLQIGSLGSAWRL